MYNLGIIGRGFVGSAVEFGFSPQTGCDIDNMYIYDIVKSKSLHSLEDVVLYSDIIFLSVPTPSNEDGSIDLSYVEDALQDISQITTDVEEAMAPVNNIILVRSTVTPGTTERLQQMFQNLNLVFNPEFLTERSANFDFINQTRFILGGDKKHTTRVADLYRWRFGETIPVIETNYQTAELIKYMNNCFFATKVSFLNEMKQVSDLCGADWNMAVEGFIRDGRIGHSHMKVPGPDGKFGFGGHCLPKDTNAMITFGESLGINMHTLKGVIDTNVEVRGEKEWENDPRAFTKKSPLFKPEINIEYPTHLKRALLSNDDVQHTEHFPKSVRQHESDKE